MHFQHRKERARKRDAAAGESCQGEILELDASTKIAN